MKMKYDLYDCFYWNKSPDFQRPPLKNIGRTVTTDNHAPAVVVENKLNMVDRTAIELPSELKGKKFRIRKLTPRECFRLMDMDDKYIDIIQNETTISNSNQYKLAGNSIVVSCLYYLFENLIYPPEEPQGDKYGQLSLF